MGKLLRIMVWLLFILIFYISTNVYVAYKSVDLHGIIKLFNRDTANLRISLPHGTVSRKYNFTSASELFKDEINRMAEYKFMKFLEDEDPKTNFAHPLTNISTMKSINLTITSRHPHKTRHNSKSQKHNAVPSNTKSLGQKSKETRKTDCYKLVSANDGEYQNEVNFIKRIKKTTKSTSTADWNIIKLIQNCTSVRTYLRRYYERSVDKSAVAYAILLDRSLEQTFRFLQNIYSPDSVYCLHVNMKAGKNYVKAIKMLSDCVDNIVLPKERFRLGIQTVYKIHAQMACFRQLLNSTVRWSFLINLPGSAFPLRNQSMIESYLKTKDHSNEISSRIPTSSRFFKRTRFEHVFQEVDGMNIYMRTKRRKPPPPKKIVLFRGEEYFIATRQFSRFATESDVASDFLNWSTDTKNPEEFFWASLHRYPGAPGGIAFRDEDEHFDMSPIGAELEDIADIPESDLLLTLWKSDGRHRCSGDYRGNLCVYGAGDLRWIISQDKLFASSFDFRVDRTCIDCLTMHLRRPLVEDHIVDYRSDFPVIF